MMTCDILFTQVVNPEFRSFFDYVNPQANILLPRSADTIEDRPQAMLEDGKKHTRQLFSTLYLTFILHVSVGVVKSS